MQLHVDDMYLSIISILSIGHLLRISSQNECICSRCIEICIFASEDAKYEGEAKLQTSKKENNIERQLIKDAL